jgi:hypothetical protein
VEALTLGAESFRRSDDVVSELTWAAHEDVGVIEVAHDASQRALVEADFCAWSAELYVLTVALFDQFGELASVNYVLGRLGSNDDRHLARRGKLFEQRSDGRYTDARSNEHDALGSETVASERAVGTFNQHPRARLKSRDCSTLITETLHGNSHVRWSRQRRE